MANTGIVIGLAVAMSLWGCASKEPTTADLMRGQASQLQGRVDLKNRLAGDWEKGKRLVESGENKIRDGQEKMEKGRREGTGRSAKGGS